MEESSSLFPTGWRFGEVYYTSEVFVSLPKKWTLGPEKTPKGGGKGECAVIYRGRDAEGPWQ